MFNKDAKPGDKCEITVTWSKDLRCGPGYVVKETRRAVRLTERGPLACEAKSECIGIGVFYGRFADADAIKCAVTHYRARKKEYCEIHRIPWDLLIVPQLPTVTARAAWSYPRPHSGALTNNER